MSGRNIDVEGRLVGNLVFSEDGIEGSERKRNVSEDSDSLREEDGSLSVLFSKEDGVRVQLRDFAIVKRSLGQHARP